MKTLHWIILVLVIALATFFVYRTRQAQPRVDTDIDLNWRFTLDDPEGAYPGGMLPCPTTG